MIRDYQRQKIYNAEAKHSHFIHDARSKNLPTANWDTLKQYVRDLTRTKWFIEKYGNSVNITVRDGRARVRASGGWYKISMPKWSRSPLIILHEIAHAIGGWKSDRHGPLFCGHFLFLVYHQLGSDAYKELKRCFDSLLVDYKDPIDGIMVEGHCPRPSITPSLTKEELIEKMRSKKRKANPAAIEALRRYREAKKAGI